MSENGLTLDYQTKGRNGHILLTARFPGGGSFTDKFDVASAKDREKFIREVVRGRKGLDRKALSIELDKIAAEVVGKPKEDGKLDGEEENKRPSQADILVKLAETAVLFHTPGGIDSKGFASFQLNGHLETWPIGSKGFKCWLGKLFYDSTAKAPNTQSIQDAINVISGRAIHEGEEKEIAVRLAQNREGIFLDLADEQWRAVHITSTGWQVVIDSPVKFLRPRGMLPLPVPMAGGNINMLRSLVNLPDDDGWRLYVAWLVAALRQGRPFPILVVNGEQGSAKSTLCKIARALVDPNKSPLRRPPKDDRDLMINATNAWIMAYDNLSGVPAQLSDAFCMVSTGGGISTRELYSDGDEKLFDATRPVMINGIEDLATRSDLLDRSLTLTLPTIPDCQRRDEDDLWERFNELRPMILGALLDAVVVALRNRPNVKLVEKPRMADFASWIVAAEPALGWPAGEFLAAYNHNRGAANSLALESSIIGPPIVALIDSLESWQGTPKELLAELEANYTDEKTLKRKDWPMSSRKLAGELRRLAPNLRKAGIEVTFGKHTKTGNTVALGKAGKTCSPCSPSSSPRYTPSTKGEHGEHVLHTHSNSLNPQNEVAEWTA